MDENGRVIFGGEQSRCENVAQRSGPKGTMMRKIEGQESKFVQLMEHHKSEGETEFLTRAGKL